MNFGRDCSSVLRDISKKERERHIKLTLGFPGGRVVKKPPASAEMREMWVQSLGQADSPE